MKFLHFIEPGGFVKPFFCLVVTQFGPEAGFGPKLSHFFLCLSATGTAVGALPLFPEASDVNADRTLT